VARSPDVIEHPAPPHLRWHSLRGEWVVYAPSRHHRLPLPTRVASPLAPGRDDEEPTEVPAGNWDIAVFENLFAPLTSGAASPPPSVVETASANGTCEIVVFTQDPDTSLGALPLERIVLLIDVWAHRTAELGAREDVAYVFPFEDRGQEVGVTLHHPHGQIYACPFVPPVAALELSHQKRHLAATGRGLLEDHLAVEIEAATRTIYVGKYAVALVPAFARCAYEAWVVPRRPAPTFSDLSTAERLDFARALKTVLLKYDALWGVEFPYVLACHQAPTDGVSHPEAHVHVEIYPAYRERGFLNYLAGCEVGAGIFTVDKLPEDSALELRAVEVDFDG
jgi:UDPglucose--hexose-1-phosphate uridylyltransferase